MEEIVPGLWIGDLACALATDYLSLAGITHIITAMKQALPSPIKLPDGRRIEEAQMYHVSIDDFDNSPILVHLPGAVDFIDEAIEQRWIEDDNIDEESGSIDGKEQNHEEGKRKGQWATLGSGTILVHCQAGISRSVAIVAAYLMKVRSISLVEALEIIQSRRSQADPNPGFRLQLELYESAGCNVDVRNQRIRRYLMSHSSILKGDPIDDVLLSYYPSPFHSPSNSYTGSLNNGMQGPANLKFSTLDEADNAEDSRSSRATSQVGSSASVSPTMSRQGSRAATAAAAANKGAQRRRSSSKADGTSTLNLSISPPMPPNANELFDNVDGSQEQDEDPSKRLIKEKFSSVKEDHEVLITISTGNLPGGVKLLKGNQGKANGDVRLPKPHFRGLKLRCKMCRTELAARDHVVEHEAGRGKDAFDVRKREKDIDAKNKDGRIVRELGIEERFGAQTRIQQPSSPPAEKDESTSTTEELNKGDEKQQMLSNGNSIQTAASLSAQLPPHLAALRQGRAGQTTSSVSPNRSAASPPQQRRMLHSSECSSYFVEPLAWMSALKLGEVAGRLDCPNARCGAKLGSWDWAGMQCACGAWVTPAFALHKSKVDEI